MKFWSYETYDDAQPSLPRLKLELQEQTKNTTYGVG